MKPLTPSVTILCLLQLFAVAGGYLLTRAFVKMYDRGWGELGALEPSAMIWPRFIAAHGLWFFILPFVWCSVVVLSARPADAPRSIRQPVLVLGLLLTIALACVFSGAVMGVLVSLKGVSS